MQPIPCNDRRAAWGDRLATLVVGRLASWIGVVFWLGVLGATIPFAIKLNGVESSRLSELLPAGAPSTKALELDRRFPTGGAMEVDVVFSRPSGLERRDLARANADLRRASLRLGRAIGPPSPLARSPNGRVAVATMSVAGNQAEVERTVTALRRNLGNGGGGLEIRVTGEAAIETDLLGTFSGTDELLLIVTGGLVAVLLAATYRSPILWLVPLASVGIAEAVARAVLFGLAHGGLTVNAENASLVTVIVFGAGTDYALLLTARYREQLRHHAEHRRAMREAWRRSAPTVVASALTVAGTLTCLLAAKLSLVSGFGVVGVIGVLSAAVVVLAAYPPLLLVLGRGVFWPAVPRHAPEFVQRGIWVWLARLVSRGNRPVWIAAVLLLGGAAIGLFRANTNIGSLSELPPSSPSAQGYALLAGNFPPGEVSPVDVVVTDLGRVAAVRRALRGLPVTASVGPVQRGATMARFDLVLAVNPSGEGGFHAINTLRAAAAKVAPGEVLIGGQTAQDLDTATASHRDILVIVPTVVTLVLVVLWTVLRALVGPLLVVGVMVTTFAAALGITSVLFVPLLHLPGLDPTVPLLTFVFLMALGTDYSIFLLVRMREEVMRQGALEGVRAAVANTGGVLTSAGIVLAATFAVLAVLPVVASREIGIVVALGVVIDTFLVRTVVLPILAADLRRWFWWPSRPSPQRSTK